MRMRRDKYVGIPCPLVTSEKVAVAAVEEFIIILGYLGGIFTRIGVDPETTLIGILADILNSFAPGWGNY